METTPIAKDYDSTRPEDTTAPKPGGGEIFRAIPSIMGELEAIGRDRVNEQQRFKYRGIDDLYNALSQLMAKHGVFTAPRVLHSKRAERATRYGGVLFHVELMIEYTFYAKDGSSFATVVCGEGMDSGDKAVNKAESVAHKYALTQVFIVRTEDQTDPDGETPPPTVPGKDTKATKGAEAKPPAKAAAKPPAKKPADAEPDPEGKITAKQNAMIWAVAAKLGYSKQDVVAVLQKHFKKESTTKLTVAEAGKVIDGWVKLLPPDDGKRDDAGTQK